MTRLMALGEVGTYFNGKAFKPSDWSTEGLPIIRIANLNDASAPFNHFLGQVAAEHRVDDGDLLVSWSASLDAYIWRRGPAVVNQHIFKVYERRDLVDRSYLWYALRSAMRGIRAQVHGATMQHITKPEFEAIRVPVPSLDEQRRIASALAEQLAVADIATRTTADAIELLVAIRRRAYDQAFAERVPLSTARHSGPSARGWSWHLLTDLARLETGHTPSRLHPEWWTGDVPWIALPDIRRLDGVVAWETGETTNAEGVANSSARILPAETVVMSRTASVGFVTRMGRPMATSQDFVNWVCGPNLDPEFLMHLLIGSRNEIRALSSGAIHKTVYMPTLKALQVCVPGIEEQRRIAAELRHRLAAIEATEASIRAERAAIEALPAALLRRAFGGLAA